MSESVRVGEYSDRGPREENQDACGTFGSAAGGTSMVLAFVADGMGGMEAGQEASQAAREAVAKASAAVSADLLTDAAQQAAFTLHLARAANEEVLEALAGRSGGTTFTAVSVVGDRVALGHVGDSRAYLFGNGRVEQLTKDHSLVAALVATGQMTPEEAEVSPDRNKILRSLGSPSASAEGYADGLIESGFGPDPTLTLGPGDGVAIMSDGVWGALGTQGIALLLNNPDVLANSEAVIAKMLVDTALASNTDDNSTAVVVRMMSDRAGGRAVRRVPSGNETRSLDNATVRLDRDPVPVAPARPQPERLAVAAAMPREVAAAPAPARSKKGLLIGAGLAGVALLGVVGAFVIGGGGTSTPPDTAGTERGSDVPFDQMGSAQAPDETAVIVNSGDARDTTATTLAGAGSTVSRSVPDKGPYVYWWNSRFWVPASDGGVECWQSDLESRGCVSGESQPLVVSGSDGLRVAGPSGSLLPLDAKPSRLLLSAPDRVSFVDADGGVWVASRSDGGDWKTSRLDGLVGDDVASLPVQSNDGEFVVFVDRDGLVRVYQNSQPWVRIEGDFPAGAVAAGWDEATQTDPESPRSLVFVRAGKLYRFEIDRNGSPVTTTTVAPTTEATVTAAPTTLTPVKLKPTGKPKTTVASSASTTKKKRPSTPPSNSAATAAAATTASTTESPAVRTAPPTRAPAGTPRDDNEPRSGGTPVQVVPTTAAPVVEPVTTEAKSS